MKHSSEPVKAAEVRNNMIKDLTEKDLAGTSSKKWARKVKKNGGQEKKKS